MKKFMFAAALLASLATGSAAMAATFSSSQYYQAIPNYPTDGGR